MKYFSFGAMVARLVVPAAINICYQNVNREKLSLVKKYNYSRNLINKVLKGMKVELVISGEYLPVEQSYVLTPNHQSFLDALVMISLSHQPLTFVAKKESLKMPLIGKVIQNIDGLFLDRDNLKAEFKTMKTVKESLMYETKKWVVFPEGTRTKNADFKMNEFKPGAFKFLMAAKKDIYPVAIWGSFRPFGKYNQYKKYPIYIHICKPIKEEQYSKLTSLELSDLIHQTIQNQVYELQKKEAEEAKKYLR